MSGFAPGDRVCALFRGALRSHLTVDARAVFRVPDGMDLTAAATVPLAFLTAHYGLGHVARLSRGQTVLVHAAAGGVGLAAVQYAQRVGARVFATAGTEHKRNLLRLLGVDLVADSRTLDFAEQVLEATGGRGVDVVLNSLSGEAVTRSLELLRSGGTSWNSASETSPPTSGCCWARSSVPCPSAPSISTRWCCRTRTGRDSTSVRSPRASPTARSSRCRTGYGPPPRPRMPSACSSTRTTSASSSSPSTRPRPSPLTRRGTRPTRRAPIW
ncbi:hypothetical protein CJI59_22995 [Streptomyces sp. Alain-F2R5]|nr:hypothetical protein CJI59_22995 [Streptomyces sp. Alain-F2R5]